LIAFLLPALAVNPAINLTILSFIVFFL
jgi:hypothetical protein